MLYEILIFFKLVRMGHRDLGDDGKLITKVAKVA
jgi:hypothetical protein